MNCEECKEQIFELIERQAVDPEAVRGILARCPDCRSAFEQTKAALALAAQLPIEEPRAAVDAAILRAASSRVPRVAPVRKLRGQPLPWAVAAIALLAVGVGVIAIPRGVQRRDQPESKQAESAADSAEAEQAVHEQPVVVHEVAPARPAAEPAAAPRSVDRASAKTRMVAASPASSERKAKRAADDSKLERMGGAPAASLAAEEVAGSVAEADIAPSASDEQAGTDSAEAGCRRQVAAFERRNRDRKAATIEPEEELAIGKCYRTLGNSRKARDWLKRAAEHRETRARAEEALHELAPE